MGYGIWKAHHGHMKHTALIDYKMVKDYVLSVGGIPVEPKGKHWHRIEEATEQMLLTIPDYETRFEFYRGQNYYSFNVNKLKQNGLHQ